MQQEQDTSDLTIVTAFFDIGRSAYGDKFSRSNEKYFNYFKFWAGIKNNLVVYTQPEFKDEVLKIRQEKGLLDKTIVITHSLEDIDLELYNVFKETFEKYPQTWRITKKPHPEILFYKYCYVNCMKSFFVCNAIQNKLISTKNIMWLDFGYNHSGDFYTDGSQFDFYLSFKKSYDQDKLIIYKMGNDTNKSMAQIYYDMSVLYIGPQLCGSSQAWVSFNKHMKESVISFAKKGMADDDQFYMLDVVRNYPNFYQIEDCIAWFDALLDFIPTETCKLLKMSGKAYKTNYFLLYEKMLKKQKGINRLFTKIQLFLFRKSLKRSISSILHQQIENKF